MKLSKTIDECIRLMRRELDGWESMKENGGLFLESGDPKLEATIEEVDDGIVEYQNHLDNLYIIISDVS